MTLCSQGAPKGVKGKMQILHSIVRPAAFAIGIAMLALGLAPRVAAAPYKSPAGYTITPPSGWTTKKGGLSGDVAFQSSTGASIAVVSQAVSPRITLEKARTSVLASLQKSPTRAFKVLGQGETTIGGLRALTVAGSYQSGKPPAKVRDLLVFVLHGGKVHLFTCTDAEARYSKSTKAFNAALASVRWTR